MSTPIVRVIVTLVFAALLVLQARGLSGQPLRKRAFELAGGALLALVGFQLALAAGVTFMPLLYVMLALACVLLIAAAIWLWRSFKSGELRPQSQQIAKAAQLYRERREQDHKRR